MSRGDLAQQLSNAALQELALVNDESLVLRKTLESRDVDLTEAKTTINDECHEGSAELRRELTATRRGNDPCAGADQGTCRNRTRAWRRRAPSVVAEQVHRLTAEREDLTDRLRALQSGKSRVGWTEAGRKRREIRDRIAFRHRVDCRQLMRQIG